MRIICLSRKECIGLLYLIVGGLALKNVLLLVDSFELGQEMNVFYHTAVTAALAFTCLFSGVATFLFNSRNSLTHTFLRFHNVCTIAPSLYYLVKTRTVYYAPYFEEYVFGIYYYTYFEHELKKLDASLPIMNVIVILGGTLVVLQGYAVYARAVIAFCRIYRPHIFQRDNVDNTN